MRFTLPYFASRLPLNFLKSGALKNTLRLPKTTFPIVADADPKKPLNVELLKKCTDELYAWQRKNLPEKDMFVLHDGPPYANGELHMGHALNKVLKDIVNRSMIMRGRRVDYRPGWDCHGLPIELKALQELREKQVEEEAGRDVIVKKGLATEGVKESAKGAMEMGKKLTPGEIRRVARSLAERTVGLQMERFREWGVMADWEGRWTTMDKEYEVRQLKVFLEMLRKGLIYRQFKPVYWSPSSGTALAEAELEYNEAHTSTAAFIKFPLTKLGPGLHRHTSTDPSDPLYAAIWTTTPWTIPANKAIAVGPELEYVILSTTNHGRLVVAGDRIEALKSALRDPEAAIEADGIMGKELLGTMYRHPLLPESSAPEQPILSAGFVTSDNGTGLVHCAPGHGMDDYHLCQLHAIPPFSPVDNAGCFTEDALPHNPALLTGKPVQYSGNKAVVQLLRDSGVLLALQEKYNHKYPYDWRTKQPVIIRSTAQWFADVYSIKDAAINSIKYLKFVPESGRKRLQKTVEGRSEWCISRQRAWGVPIPAMYNEETGEPLLTEESVRHIIDVIATHGRGVDIWWDKSLPEDLFVPEHLRGGEGQPKWVRGTETMDVWFDSGSSWATLLDALHSDPDSHRPLADLYLEGSDQHRGWFQSSLLTKIASSPTETTPIPHNPSPKATAPFGIILTHGFVLDERCRKMSKSLGNIINPTDITSGIYPPLPPGSKKNIYGAGSTGPGIDALRLWAASCDYTGDVTVGEKVLRSIGEKLRKLRITGRYLVGNLSDWDGVPIPYNSLSKLDKHALEQLLDVNRGIKGAYAEFLFRHAVDYVYDYASVLSAGYLNTVKDRIYSDSPTSLSRRAAQTTLWYILRNYLSIIHPITPLLAEEIWWHVPPGLKKNLPPCNSVAELGWFEPPRDWDSGKIDMEFKLLGQIGRGVNTAVETAREKGRIKVALETDITLQVNSWSYAAEVIEKYRDELAQLFIVSKVDVVVGSDYIPLTGEEVKIEVETGESSDERVCIVVRAARGKKCMRCWIYHAEEEGGVCKRCEGVVLGMAEQGEVDLGEEK